MHRMEKQPERILTPLKNFGRPRSNVPNAIGIGIDRLGRAQSPDPAKGGFSEVS
jgi:hypothetical protein